MPRSIVRPVLPGRCMTCRPGRRLLTHAAWHVQLLHVLAPATRLPLVGNGLTCSCPCAAGVLLSRWFRLVQTPRPLQAAAAVPAAPLVTRPGPAGPGARGLGAVFWCRA